MADAKKSPYQYVMDAWPQGVALNPAKIGKARGDHRTAGYAGKRASFIWQIYRTIRHVYVFFGKGDNSSMVEGALIEYPDGTFSVREASVAYRESKRVARATRAARDVSQNPTVPKGTVDKGGAKMR